jgi:ubiquinone/menaquinone biosynthesis C-methylase UbiE
MNNSNRIRRRTSFDDVAELYDKARPAYPTELIDDLVDLSSLSKESRVLEVGCGTGQLTGGRAWHKPRHYCPSKTCWFSTSRYCCR